MRPRAFGVPLFFCLTLAACAHQTQRPPATSKVNPDLELPDVARPLGYNLDLDLSPSQDTFAGAIRVEIWVEKKSDQLWLHARGLDIQSGSYTSAQKRSLPLQWKQQGETLALNLPGESFEPGPATLEFRYQGRISAN